MEHGLPIAAHGGEPEHGAIPAGHHAGDQGVEGPLPRREAVGMLRIHVEIRAAVVEDDARPRRHHARAECAEKALDHGQDSALAVGDDEAGGVAVHVAPHVLLGLLWIEVCATALGIALVEEPLDRRPRLRGIGDPSIAIGVGELGRFEEEMQALRGVRRVLRHLESFQQVQGEERGQSLGRRRRLVHRVAAIGRGKRRSPFALVRCEVVGGEEALALEAPGDGTADPAAVEEVRVGAELGDGAGEIGLPEHVARLGEDATGDEDASPLGIVEEREALADGLAHDVRDGKAVGRILDGRREQLAHGASAEAVEQHRPRTRDARDGYRARPYSGNRGEAAAPELVKRRARARAPRAVQEVHAAGCRLVIEAEEVAAEAAVVGLGDAEDGVGRHCRVDDVAARPQRLHAGERGERMTRGHHAIPPHGRLPMRVADLWHLCSEGGSSPLPNLPPETDGAGKARARSATPFSQRSRHLQSVLALPHHAEPPKMRVISSCGNAGMGRGWPTDTRVTHSEAEVTRAMDAPTVADVSQTTVTASASPGATVMSSDPEAMVPSGSRLNTSQSRRPSASTGTRSRSIRNPTPAAWASSQHAVARPPSVGSCMACTRAAAHAARDSATTLMPGARRKPRARSTTSAATPRRTASSPRSRAMMAAPSSGTPLVRSTASPTCAPPVVTSASLPTSPSMVPTTIGRGRPAVTSVWPPTRATLTAAQASATSAKSCSTSPSWLFPSGRSTVARNQRGVAPRTARSLALTCRAYQPISSVVKVMGSVVATR